MLIGAGRVGTAVTALLQRSGHHILGVASRSPASASRAAGLLAAPVVEVGDMPMAEVVLLGVPEGALGEVASEVAAQARTKIVCHFAGVAGIGPLSPVLDAGMLAAALHPVQACPDVETAIRRLPGSAWGVTTSPEISAWAHEVITRDLHGEPVDVEERHRPLWHAAAATTANGIAALLSLAGAMLADIGIEQPGGVLGPLAAGVLAGATTAGGTGQTLTGPVARGDAMTVRAHVEALRSQAPDLLEAYRAAAATILLAAVRTEDIGPATENTIRAALEG
ncbi:MAG: DUF2520 domain-containing protein [Actinomycetota bacterium]|nr:DUF2520 domain-containing protein [Actinomycetota bacterium]